MVSTNESVGNIEVLVEYWNEGLYLARGYKWGDKCKQKLKNRFTVIFIR